MRRWGLDYGPSGEWRTSPLFDLAGGKGGFFLYPQREYDTVQLRGARLGRGRRFASDHGAGPGGPARPCALEPHCWSTLLPPDRFSFPSGHSITAFAICTPLVLQYPAAAPGILFCAVSIAASRIILGMHFLSDVVAGSVLGWMLGRPCGSCS